MRVVMRRETETKRLPPRPLSFPFRSARLSPWTPLRDGLPLQQLPTQFRPGSGHPIVLLGASFHHPRFHPVRPVGVDHDLGQRSPSLADANHRNASM